MSEARKRILLMLAGGKITVEQSEELLSAIDQDEQGKKEKEPETGDSCRVDIANIAKTVQTTLREAFKKVEPPSRELKSRLKEFGGWMQNFVTGMAGEFANAHGEPIDGISVDFSVPEPEELSNCSICLIENLFGDIRVSEGESFSLKIGGRISQAALEGQPPNLWFINKAVRIENDTLIIGLDRRTPTKAVLNIDLILPKEISIKIKTVSAAASIKGGFRITDLHTVSGDINVKNCVLDAANVETVSGNLRIEGGKIEMNVKSTSGDLTIKTGFIQKITAQSVSGDLLITDCEVDETSVVEAMCTSGDIAVEKISGPWRKVEVNTRTGIIKTAWRGASSSTGQNGSVIESGNPGAEFSAETVSGDIAFE